MEEKKTVGIFYSSITNIHKAPHKQLLMDNFRDGVHATGDIVVEYRSRVIPVDHMDCAFVLGYTLEQNYRGGIIADCKERGIPVVFVDSNILHYSNPGHEWHRYSMNSVYPSDGTYFFGDLEDKWDHFSSSNGVTLKPWRSVGDHILILAQRGKGWNLKGIDQVEWIVDTVEKVREYSARPIVIRMHPGDGNRVVQIDRLLARLENVTISSNPNIVDDLHNCWCTIGYNSTPNVVARIEGVPGYVHDPINSWAKDTSFSSLNLIETPMVCDRGQWLNEIANIHWSGDEVKSGKLWKQISNYISTSRI